MSEEQMFAIMYGAALFCSGFFFVGACAASVYWRGKYKTQIQQLREALDDAIEGRESWRRLAFDPDEMAALMKLNESISS